MAGSTPEQRLRSVRRQIAAWSVISAALFIVCAFATVAAVANDTGGAWIVGVVAALALAAFVYLRSLRARIS
jgi:hypothetical protein